VRRGTLALTALAALIAIVGVEARPITMTPREPARRARAERGRVAPAPPAPAWESFSPTELPDNAPTRVANGRAWIGANDLARLLDATKFWRPDVRKLLLRAHGHRVQLAVDNPFVLVDERVILLPLPVQSVGGELQAPVALLDSLPRDSALARLVYDARRSLVFRVPESGIVGSPRVVVGAGETRITFPVDRPEDVSVIGRARDHFRVRFGGFFIGSLPESISATGAVRAVRQIPAPVGSAFEFVIAPGAAGYRLERDAAGSRVSLVASHAAGPGLEAFAPEGPAGPRPVRVIVIDPGHGGGDAGVSVAGAVEKDLTLALARLLRAELARRTLARVILTRDDDRALTVEARAERANRERADLVLSLHFDGAPGAAARGATAYCPPATLGATAELEADAGGVRVLPWRDVAIRHAVRSRELAEALLASLELTGQGPTRLRETLPYPLLGVNAPGLVLECAMLTSDADRARVMAPQGLQAIAAALASGIDAYRNSQ
jgi:N-acetylmuramoyl-L-alanine amidase